MYTVYTKPGCTNCDKAKMLLTTKQQEVVEITLDVGQSKEESKQYIGLTEFKTIYPDIKSLPLIVKGDTVIGGLRELSASL